MWLEYRKHFVSNKCRSSGNSKRLKTLLFQSCIHWECRRFKNSYPSSQTAVAVSPNSTPVYTNCPFWISPTEPQSFPLQPKNRNNLTWQYCISRIFIVMSSKTNYHHHVVPLFWITHSFISPWISLIEPQDLVKWDNAVILSNSRLRSVVTQPRLEGFLSMQ